MRQIFSNVWRYIIILWIAPVFLSQTHMNWFYIYLHLLRRDPTLVFYEFIARIHERTGWGSWSTMLIITIKSMKNILSVTLKTFNQKPPDFMLFFAWLDTWDYIKKYIQQKEHHITRIHFLTLFSSSYSHWSLLLY